MSILISHESELGRELAKWEQHRTKYVGDEQSPGNPYVYRPYPRMLYRAEKRSDGRHVCIEQAPHPYSFERMDQYAQAQLAMEAWNRSHTRTVQSEDEERRAKNEGWRNSPDEALSTLEAREQAIGLAAAEAAAKAQRMSELARREFAEAEQATHEHVTDVQPARKRGRPAKGIVPVAGHALEDDE